jgi:hypothetical protein
MCRWTALLLVRQRDLLAPWGGGPMDLQWWR